MSSSASSDPSKQANGKPAEPPAEDSGAPPATKWVDELDHSMAAVQLGDEPSEPVVEDKSEMAASVAERFEERVEEAAAAGVLGGPMIWGWVLLMVLVAIVGVLVLD